MPTRTAPVQASCVYRACDILGQRVARRAPGSANVPPPRRRGPQVRASWHHGAMGPSTSWDPWPYPVARAAVGTKSVHRSAKTASRSRSGAFVYTVAPSWAGVGAKECTQIGENGPTEPFWGICVHCCDASRVGWNEGLDRHGAPAPAPPLAWRLR